MAETRQTQPIPIASNNNNNNIGIGMMPPPSRSSSAPSTSPLFQQSEQRSSSTGSCKDLGEYMLNVKEKIGGGTFANVYKGFKKDTLEEVAIKAISKKNLSKKLLDNMEFEISTLKSINHPNIVALYDIKKSKKHIFIVLEYCGGGDLSEYIKQRGPLPENVAKHFLVQLASGLHYLRSRNLIHRDLKPHNLLLSEKSDFATLKIADFGFARQMLPESLAETLCGSPLYMAPEIMKNQKYDSKVDLWSVGTILFQFLTGRPPFRGDNHVHLLNNIETKQWEFPKGFTVSAEFESLLRGLLQRDPEKRMTFEQFFNHPLIALANVSPYPAVNSNINNNSKNNVNNNANNNARSDVIRTVVDDVNDEEDDNTDRRRSTTGDGVPRTTSTALQTIAKQSAIRDNEDSTNNTSRVGSNNNVSAVIGNSSPPAQQHATPPFPIQPARQPRINPFKREDSHSSFMRNSPDDMSLSSSPGNQAPNNNVTAPRTDSPSPMSTTSTNNNVNGHGRSISPGRQTMATLTNNQSESINLAASRDSVSDSIEKEYVMVNGPSDESSSSADADADLSYLVTISDSGHINYPSTICDFSNYKLGRFGDNEELSLVLEVETAAKRAWVITEFAHLEVHAGHLTEGLALYIKALDMLHNAFLRARNLQSNGWKSERLTAIEEWVRDRFIQFLEKAEQLKEKVPHLNPMQMVSPDMLLYQYALKLGREAAVEEFMNNFSNSAAMYWRSLCLFEYLLSITLDSSDKEILVNYIKGIRKRVDTIKLKSLRENSSSTSM